MLLMLLQTAKTTDKSMSNSNFPEVAKALGSISHNLYVNPNHYVKNEDLDQTKMKQAQALIAAGKIKEAEPLLSALQQQLDASTKKNRAAATQQAVPPMSPQDWEAFKAWNVSNFPKPDVATAKGAPIPQDPKAQADIAGQAFEHEFGHHKDFIVQQPKGQPDASLAVTKQYTAIKPKTGPAMEASSTTVATPKRSLVSPEMSHQQKVAAGIIDLVRNGGQVSEEQKAGAPIAPLGVFRERLRNGR